MIIVAEERLGKREKDFTASPRKLMNVRSGAGEYRNRAGFRKVILLHKGSLCRLSVGISGRYPTPTKSVTSYVVRYL